MSEQHPLGSGFTAASTGEDVVAGIDLTRTNVIITGGHGRLGREATRVLAQAGASVTVASRDAEKAKRALEGIDRVEVSALDLLDPKSITAFAQRWLDSKRPLHVLVNNAAAGRVPSLTRDARGYEVQFATSHLGHFQLTLQLLPALRAAHGARIINVSSGRPSLRSDSLRRSEFRFRRIQLRRCVRASETSQRALCRGARSALRKRRNPRLFAASWSDRRGEHACAEALRAQGLIDDAGNPIIDPARGKKNVQQGASTIVFAATSPLLANVGGVYLKDNDVAPLVDEMRALTADDIPSEAARRHSIRTMRSDFGS